MLYYIGRVESHIRFATSRLDMKCRQDAFAMLWYLFSPRDDRISIEVYMQEGCMPDTVLAVAPPKQMKAMLRDEGGEDGTPQFRQTNKISHCNPPLLMTCWHTSQMSSR